MVAVPTKPGTWVKLTCPVGSVANVPCPAIVIVVCTPGVLGSRSTVVGASVVLEVSLPSTGRVTGVLYGVMLESGLAIGAGGATTVTFSSPGLVTAPEVSLTVYGVVTTPVKPATGLKVTIPVALTVNVPLPATVKLESGVAVLGSRSTLPGTTVLPGLATSLDSASRSTGVLNGVVALSSIAAGTTTVTFRLAGLLVCPMVSLMVYGRLETPVKFRTGVKVTTPVLGLSVNVPSSSLVKLVC